AVDVPDLRPDPAADRPGDQPVLVELADGDGDVVAAHRKVVEGLAVHVHNKAVADGPGGVAFGVLQHPGCVDGDVALRVAQDGEDVGSRCGDGALDFDAFGHSADLVTTETGGEAV